MIGLCRVRFVTAFAVCSSVSAVGLAQAPTISTTAPLAVKPGDTTDLTVRGGNLAGITQLWTSFPCEAALSPDVKDNGKNAGQCVYRLNVPADAPLGVHAIRVTTPKGTSPLRLVVVDDLPSVAAASNNKQPDAAQELNLPVAVDGVIGALSRDYFKFNVEAGQRVSFQVLARQIGSALDPIVRLLDARGRELTYNDDALGQHGDCQLSYTFADAGQYVLELRDIRYQGGGNSYYRLRIGDFPLVTVPYPMGVQRGSEATVSFAGSQTDGVTPVKFTVPNDPGIQWLTIGGQRATGGGSGFGVLSVSDSKEVLETEPNNDPDKANRVTLGANLNGRLDQDGDSDRYVFAATKGQKFSLTANTRRLGSPADLRLRLLNSSGKQVAESDDAGTNDAAINYTFPADGDFTLLVEDLIGRGGPEFAYRIAVEPSQTGFSLAATADRLNVPAGGTASITVNSVRQGYKGPIHVAVEGLPAGASSVPTVIGPGMNSVVLTVNGTPELEAGKMSPVRIVGTAQIGDQEFRATATIDGALKAAFNNMPYPPSHLKYETALAAAPETGIRLRTEPAQIVFGRDLKASVKVIAERGDGFDEAITLAVTPAKNGLPGGITAAVKPIPKGKNEIDVVFSANNKAPLGQFTAAFVASHKKGKATTSVPVPGVGLKLDQPFRLTTDPGSAKLAQGGKLKVKVSVERNPAFSAPIALTVQNLPEGVTVPKATIPADKQEIEIEIAAAQDAKPQVVKNLTIQGDATVGKAKFTATSPAATLTVE